MQNVDYHVGLLRGFLLATNAHQQILHALEVVLTYRREAGEVICAPKTADIEENLRNAVKKAQEDSHKNIQPVEEKIIINRPEDGNSTFTRWSPEDKDQLVKLHRQGLTVKEMVPIMNRFKYSQIYNKHMSLDLIPHSQKRI